MTRIAMWVRASVRLSVVTAALVSCGGGGDGGVGPGGADPGDVIVSFSSSRSDVGAIQVLVPAPSGGAATNFTVGSAYDGYTKAVSGGTRIIVFGPFTNGDIMRFTVPDRGALTGFTITRESAAAHTTYALYSGSEFTLAIRNAPKTAASVSGWRPMASAAVTAP